jgi:hypothetical protein
MICEGCKKRVDRAIALKEGEIVSCMAYICLALVEEGQRCTPEEIANYCIDVYKEKNAHLDTKEIQSQRS